MSHRLGCCECTRDERWYWHHKHSPIRAEEWRSAWTSTWQRQQQTRTNRPSRAEFLVPGCEVSQSQAAALVFCQSTQCQPKHVTERLESPTPHREIIVPCGTHCCLFSSQTPVARQGPVISMTIIPSTCHQTPTCCIPEVLIAQPDKAS